MCISKKLTHYSNDFYSKTPRRMGNPQTGKKGLSWSNYVGKNQTITDIQKL